MKKTEQATTTTKKSWFTPRQKIGIELAFVVAVVAMVAVTYCVTDGSNRGFLFGSGQTTIAVALASALLVPLVATRIINSGKRIGGEKGAVAIMAGTVVLIAGAAPLQLVALDLHHRTQIIEAKFEGYSHATRVGRLAEKHPQDARKIGNLIGFEIMREALGPGFSAEWDKDMSDKIDARWKELGIDGSERAATSAKAE